MLIILLALGGLGGGLYAWLLADLPSVRTTETRLVHPTTQILDRKGRLLYEVVDPNAGKQLTLRLDSLPTACIQATLATEDKRFYQHPGFDLIAIARATWQYGRAGGNVMSGASTLTQQLARNLFLSQQERYTQSLSRKLREAYLAWQLEHRYTKDELLALYLNQTYYGNFAFGIEAAAQVFFAKPAAQLSQAECALLAGLMQSPTAYNPLQAPETAKARQLTVLRLMQEAGYINANQAKQIASEPLHYGSHLFNIQAPHFVMYVQDLLAQQVGLEQLRAGGLRVTTTLDLDLQQQAERAVQYRLDLLNCRQPGLCTAKTDRNRRVDNAGAVILDSQTGEILAMVGSPDYFNERIQGNVNATLILRQPGSAIKPLTYAAALDPSWSAKLGLQPLTPASIIPDLDATFYVKDQQGNTVPYKPMNYDQRYHGPVSLRTALANSYNIPAVKTLDRIGVNTLQQLARQAGISTFNKQYGLALTLGGGEVKLLELTAAFGIFEQGTRLEPKAILGIANCALPVAACTGDQATAGVAQANRSPLIDPATAYLITDILSDHNARMPAFGQSSVLDLPFAAAVKTGTTTDWRDNWTIGYSTRRLVGVWVGNADNQPMIDVSGIDGAGPIWHDLMLAAHPQPPPAFRQPNAIKIVNICAPSGLLASPDCPRTRAERFIHGTEPTQIDHQFQPITIDLATGLRATAATPQARAQRRIYWLLPPEYTNWMLSQGIALAPPAPDRNSSQATGHQLAATQTTQPLVLTAPTSNIGYEIHPGVPRERQRIEVAGYSADGEPWAELRLVKDGTILARATNATRISAWWVLEPGQHQFWLEGVQKRSGATIRSDHALVAVENFTAQPLEVNTNPTTP
ncbi:MAG: transglycosylase domain-containing protein [Chloroflexi bacterium]|nr:transglycosylase domain-containing protein [Chloroflexota bacterium]